VVVLNPVMVESRLSEFVPSGSMETWMEVKGDLSFVIEIGKELEP